MLPIVTEHLGCRYCVFDGFDMIKDRMNRLLTVLSTLLMETRLLTWIFAALQG